MDDTIRRRDRVASLAYPERLVHMAQVEITKLETDDCRVKTAIWHLHQAREQLGDYFDGVDHAERVKAIARAQAIAGGKPDAA